MGRIVEQRVRANGIQFNVAGSEGGGSPPVVFLHGFPESWIAWRLVMESLPGVRVYAPDLRGYGRSERPPEGYDVWTLIEDVRALIEELRLDRPVLVGNDWGGALVWMFGHRHSELVRRLVVVNCTHPKTLVHAVIHFEQLQTFRIPWVPVFQLPKFPEWFLTTKTGRRLHRRSFTIRDRRAGRRGDRRLRRREGRDRGRHRDGSRPRLYYVIGCGTNIDILTIDVISREILSIGNLVGTYTDLQKLMTLTAQGKVNLHTTPIFSRRSTTQWQTSTAVGSKGRGILVPEGAARG